MKSLLDGELTCFLDAVKSDNTLCLCIRGDYINIYYRGGNLLKIEEQQKQYKFSFNLGYTQRYREKIGALAPNDYIGWYENIPFIKSEMDTWFSKNPKPEREFQQVILRENNFISTAEHTNYRIADIEYKNNEIGCCFDMLALKYTGKGDSARLAYIEVKYGHKALSGDSGLQKHFVDMHRFLSNSDMRQLAFNDAQTTFDQLKDLGLIKYVKKFPSLSNDKAPEFILALANLPSSNNYLRRIAPIIRSNEYQQLKELCDVKIAHSSFMGYGLYSDAMVPFEDFVHSLEA